MINGYSEYKRREFCKDVKCPKQIDLDGQKEGTVQYEEIRKICKTNCCHTTYDFHHWLMGKGYMIVKHG